MSLSLPHTEDLRTDAKLIGKIRENFSAIQQEDTNDDQRNQQWHDELIKELKRLNTRLNNLDKQKATHDEVKGLRKEMLGRIRHIYMGDDHEAIRDVILQMKKKGEI